MLRDKDAAANIAVRDLGVAREFYEKTLGLPLEMQDSEVLVFRSGNSTINVYRSEYAGTNKATAVTWAVGDGLEGLVGDLKSKGVSFEHYDLPGLTQKDDVHVADGMGVAWFKDPDGNILNLISE
jgi:catechol 2,3-dioxygenase-like lactoylglutathione lyase family enzyme